jgi:FKBP-type peptidyl-prolyl cis-trans isomerase
MKLKLPLITAFVAALGLSACGGGSSSTTGTPTSVVSSPATLTKTDEIVGAGADAVVGRNVQVNYTGWLYNAAVADHKGAQFDTSYGRAPLSFTLGAYPEQVISGFDQGVMGMRVGGKRLVEIPSSMAYGASGAGSNVPPNSGLVFEIDLISVF